MAQGIGIILKFAESRMTNINKWKPITFKWQHANIRPSSRDYRGVFARRRQCRNASRVKRCRELLDNYLTKWQLGIPWKRAKATESKKRNAGRTEGLSCASIMFFKPMNLHFLNTMQLLYRSRRFYCILNSSRHKASRERSELYRWHFETVALSIQTLRMQASIRSGYSVIL